MQPPMVFALTTRFSALGYEYTWRDRVAYSTQVASGGTLEYDGAWLCEQMQLYTRAGSWMGAGHPVIKLRCRLI